MSLGRNHTTARLQLSPLDIYGRDVEQEALKEGLKQAEFSRRIVWLRGAAGCGKSFLTEWLEREVDAYGGVFACGKYTINQQDEPYAAFSQICRKICSDIYTARNIEPSQSQGAGMDGSTEVETSWCDDHDYLTTLISSELESQAALLTRIVPALRLVLVDDDEVANAAPSTRAVIHEERHQMHRAFRAFFRVISKVRRLVLVIDDLQWADQASLDLLDYLVKELQNQVLIVGCYRNNEVADASSLASIVLESLKTERGSASLIEIGNLDVNSVNSIICAALGADSPAPERTFPLAEVIHSKTLGNAFYSVHFLKSLVEEQLLVRSASDESYCWDLREVKILTTATSDAIQLIQSKLEKLPKTVHELTQLASCLGTEVYIDLFQLLVDDYHVNRQAYFSLGSSGAGNKFQRHNMSEILNFLVSEGIVFQSEEGVFRWAHDEIQEAACIHKSTRAVIHFRIGELLLQKLDEAMTRRHIFIVVRLMNDGSELIRSTDCKKRVALAKLNLLAGRISQEAASFDSAKEYFQRGIDLVPLTTKQDHVALRVDLYSSAAEAEYGVGDMENMEKHCREVIAFRDIGLLLKKRAYNTLLEGLNSQSKPSQAVSLSMKILDKLGCHVSPSFLLPRIIAGLQHCKSIEKRGLSREFEKVPAMSDPYLLWTMELLADLFKYAYFDNQSNFAGVVILKSFQWILKYGRCPTSPVILAQVGMLLASVGSFQVGKSYMDYALNELEQNQSKGFFCDTYVVVFSLVWHWTDEIGAGIDHMVHGYKAGLAVGTSENALLCFIHDPIYGFFTGKPLLEIQAKARIQATEAADFQVTKVHDYALFLLQSIENLIGTTELQPSSTSRLVGSVIDTEEKARRYESAGDHVDLALLKIFQAYVAFLFEDFESVLECRRFVESNVPGWGGLLVLTYVNGLAAASMFRTKKKRKYKRIAKRIYGKIQHWVNAGNPNVVHYALLLKAELADISGQPSSELYEAAIALSRKRNHLNDEAIGYQRYAEFCSRRNKLEDANRFFQQASITFSKWGAQVKAHQISKKYGLCANAEEEESTGHLDIDLDDSSAISSYPGL